MNGFDKKFEIFKGVIDKGIPELEAVLQHHSCSRDALELLNGIDVPVSDEQMGMVAMLMRVFLMESALHNVYENPDSAVELVDDWIEANKRLTDMVNEHLIYT